MEVVSCLVAYGVDEFVYELLSGVKPVLGTTVEQLFENILNEKPNLEPLHEADVPPAAIDLVNKCLAKQPGSRPPSFEVICGALEEILGPGALRLQPLPPAAAAVTPAPPGKTATQSRTPWGTALLAALAAIAFIVMAYYIFALRR